MTPELVHKSKQMRKNKTKTRFNKEKNEQYHHAETKEDTSCY